MAVFSAVDFSIVYNGFELSPYVKSIDLPIEIALLDTTGFGTTNNSYVTRTSGLKDWKATISVMQDFTGSQVDSVFGPDAISPVARTLTVKPTSSAVSAVNPRYFGSVLLDGYTPITASVGELAMAPISLAGAGALTRATT